MPAALLGRKIGMSRYFTDDGRNIPVTVIEAGPCAVTQVRTTETDGYSAVQLAFGDMKARRSTMPLIVLRVCFRSSTKSSVFVSCTRSIYSCGDLLERRLGVGE